MKNKNDHISPVSIAVTIGDPSGIGPEVLLSLLDRVWEKEPIKLNIFASRSVLDECAAKLYPKLTISGNEIRGCSLDCSLKNIDPELIHWSPGKPSLSGAKTAWKALDSAIESVMTGESKALVTGPIHKAQMMKVGFPEAGHTDYLAAKSGTVNPVMLYDAQNLRVALATTHIPFRSICDHLSPDRIFYVATLLNEYLKKQFVTNPKIAIAGLNPHSGSGDVFEQEEETIIAPAVRRLVQSGIIAEGPIAPDTVFYRTCKGEYDGVVSLYHDQGSIPVKTINFERAVNVTLGIPFIRTSVDHGTAFDIAGTGTASSVNLKVAVELAVKLIRGS